jgi:Cu-Zn family superoxide dismutase
MKRRILHLSCALLLAACGQQQGESEETMSATETTGMEEGEPSPAQETDSVRVDVRDAEGNTLGTVVLRDADGGVQMTGALTGLPPGQHGFHIHETGRCEPPSFKSAGGHFNPTGRKHGFDHPAGPHAGDLRNLQVVQDSSTVVSTTDSLVTLREGESALLDADGSALVIHAEPDDYITQPSGDSGDRIACGVIAE